MVIVYQRIETGTWVENGANVREGRLIKQRGGAINNKFVEGFELTGGRRMMNELGLDSNKDRGREMR